MAKIDITLPLIGEELQRHTLIELYEAQSEWIARHGSPSWSLHRYIEVRGWQSPGYRALLGKRKHKTPLPAEAFELPEVPMSAQKPAAEAAVVEARKPGRIEPKVGTPAEAAELVLVPLRPEEVPADLSERAAIEKLLGIL